MAAAKEEKMERIAMRRNADLILAFEEEQKRGEERGTKCMNKWEEARLKDNEIEDDNFRESWLVSFTMN